MSDNDQVGHDPFCVWLVATKNYADENWDSTLIDVLDDVIDAYDRIAPPPKPHSVRWAVLPGSVLMSQATVHQCHNTRESAQRSAQEGDATWPRTAPHRVVRVTTYLIDDSVSTAHEEERA